MGIMGQQNSGGQQRAVRGIKGHYGAIEGNIRQKGQYRALWGSRGQYWVGKGRKGYKMPVEGSMHLGATSARCTLQVVRNRSQPLQNSCTSVQLHFPPQCGATFNQEMSVLGEATKKIRTYRKKEKNTILRKYLETRTNPNPIFWVLVLQTIQVLRTSTKWVFQKLI